MLITRKDQLERILNGWEGLTGLDIECNGLDTRLHKILTFQFGNLKDQYIITDPDLMKIAAKRLSKHQCIGHNIKFDYIFIKHHLKVDMKNLVDTMVNEMILTTGNVQYTSLAKLAEKYLGKVVDKDVRELFVGVDTLELSEDMIKYAKYDVVLPIRIFEIQLRILKARKLMKVFQLESAFIPVLGNMEYNGLNINGISWMELYDRNKLKYDKALSILKEEADILWSSPKQVINVFEDMGIDTTFTKKGKTKKSVAEDALERYAGIDIVDKYTSWNKLKKAVTTYGAAFLEKHLHPVSGRLHTSYMQILNTGRLSSRNPDKN